jgi:DNA repair exonuclease SbcCD ATPase subunit
MATENGRLAVRLIRLENIGGIRGTLEVPLGEITYLEGDNGVGKSSVINGIAALCGGSVADLLTQGEEEGGAYLELTDDTWFRRQITADGGNDLTAGHPEQGKIGRAASWLRATLAAASLSPAEFLAADDAKAAEMILRAAPLRVSAKEIAEACGPDVGVPAIGVEGHALVVLDAAAKTLYDARREENRLAKESRTTAEQLSRSIPEGSPDPDAMATEVERMEGVVEEIRKSAETEKAKAADAVRDAVDQHVAELDQEIEEHVAEVRRLEAALAEANGVCRVVQGQRTAVVQRRDAEAGQAAREAAAPWREKYATAFAELGAAREARESAVRAEAALRNTREMIASQEAKAKAAHERSRAMTQAMARLDALKAAKAAELPVAGVSIEDGRLLIGGVPAHRANEAERVRVALDASTAQKARVPFVFADRLESLSTRTRKAVESACLARGIQVLGARVTDAEELTVRAAEDPAEVAS